MFNFGSSMRRVGISLHGSVPMLLRRTWPNSMESPGQYRPRYIMHLSFRHGRLDSGSNDVDEGDERSNSIAIVQTYLGNPSAAHLELRDLIPSTRSRKCCDHHLQRLGNILASRVH